MRAYLAFLCVGSLLVTDPSLAAGAPEQSGGTEILVRLRDPASADAAIQGIAGRSSDFAAFGSPAHAGFLGFSRRSPAYRSHLPPNHPTMLLDSYILLQYPTPAATIAAFNQIRRVPNVISASIEKGAVDFSAVPSDPLYTYSDTVRNASVSGNAQSEVYALLGLPGAWDLVPGQAYLAAADNGVQATHPDLRLDLRTHFSKNVGNPSEDPTNIDEWLASGTYRGHGTHVSGLIAAASNNTIGGSGACWSCSLMMMRITSSFNTPAGFSCPSGVAAIREATASGAQAINMSLHLDGVCKSDDDRATVTAALAEANAREVSVIAAGGNSASSSLDYPASESGTIAVTATTADGALASFSSTGAVGKLPDFATPGERIFSTFYDGYDWNPNSYPNDPGTSCINQGTGLTAYGYCTGTSMSSPIMTGIVGIVRSANPLLSNADAYNALASTADRHGNSSYQVGNGIPNVAQAVQKVLYGPSGNRGVTPLFALYSSGANNRFYTTVPQMAAVAIAGTLKHGAAGYASAPYAAVPAQEGTAVAGYPAFPDTYATSTTTPVAALNIFTTANRYGRALVPLYRMSSSTGTGGVSHFYSTDLGEVGAAKASGYVLDGVEGYIYPTSAPQPFGTVKVFRKYNSSADRYALFPESEYQYFSSLKYTSMVGSADAIGYACPNPAGRCGKRSSWNLPLILQLLD